MMEDNKKPDIFDDFAKIITSMGFRCSLCPFEDNECEDGLFVQPCLSFNAARTMLLIHYGMDEQGGGI